MDPSIDENVVRDLMVAATRSTVESVRVPAQTHLLALEKMTGFPTLLLNIANDRGTSEELRLGAILILKDVVLRVWRPRSDPPITNDEKTSIKARLLSEFMQEESDLVAVQVALVVAKVAKFDWRSMWPDLVPTLASVFLNETGLPQLRALLMMHHMLKAFRSGKGGFIQFHETANDIFAALLELWRKGGDLVLDTLSAFSRGELEESQLSVVRYDAEVSKWALKILATLVVYAFPDFSTEPLAVSFYQAILERFPVTLECAATVQQNPLSRYVHVYNKVFGKLLVDCQDHDSHSFLAIAEPALNFALDQIRVGNHIDNNTVRCLKLVKSVVLSLGKVGEYKDNDGGRMLEQQVFTEARVSDLCQTLIQNYFAFTFEELEEWTSSPEQVYHDQMNTSEADDVPRHHAEDLFLAAIAQWPNIALPLIEQTLESCSREAQMALSSGRAEDLEEYFSVNRILFRDACTHVLVCAHYSLLHINFSEWFVNNLQKEFQEALRIPLEPIVSLAADGSVVAHDFDYRTSILKRRVCRLIGTWVDDISAELRPQAYDIVVGILRTEQDLCVVLTAVWALGYLVTDLTFATTFELFEPLIDTVITSLFNTLGRCKMTESQLSILSALGHVIEGISSHVIPYTTKILELVSDLWNSSPDSLMQTAVIRVLSHLVVSLQGDATLWYQHLLPIIDYSTHVNGRSSDNGILEDGILLWLNTLRSATEFSESLLSLFPNLRHIIHGGLTPVILQLCIKLVESYVLLGQVDFLQAHVADLADVLGVWLDETSYEGSDRKTSELDGLTGEVMRPLEIMLMLYPTEMPHHFEGTLYKLLNLIWSEQESQVSLCYYLHFFNRLLLHNPQFYLSWLEKVGQQGGQADLVTTFLNLVIEKIDQLGSLRRRKIAAMALSNLLEITPLLENEPDLIALAIQTAIGVVHDEAQGEGPEYIVRPDERNLAEDFSVPELKPNSVQARQLRLLFHTDPVNKFSGKHYLLARFAAAEQQHPELFQQVLGRVEPLVLELLYTEKEIDDEEAEEAEEADE